MDPILSVERVSKTYLPPPPYLRPLVRVAASEPIMALREVSLTVRAGDILGLVGTNGAGKSTLLKIVASLLVPTRGRVLIDGIDVNDNPRETCRRLGLVLEGDRGIYDRLTGVQNLEFFGIMAGLHPRDARRRADELMEMLNLADRDKLVFGYSAGMRMRLSIARALLADPPLIILDEPTRSLDPLASRATMRLLQRLASEGRGVLLSNHRLDEVVSTCSHVVALADGEVRYSGDAKALAAGSTGAADALADLLEHQATAP